MSVKRVMKTNKRQLCGEACDIKPCDKCKDQKKKDEELLERQTRRIEDAIEKIKSKGQGRVGNIYKMKTEIAGPKKTPQEASAIRDPKTGELLVNKEQIKETTLEYCVNNLKNNIPDDEVKELVNTRKDEQLKKMEDKTGEGFEVTYEEYNHVLAKFEKKILKHTIF